MRSLSVLELNKQDPIKRPASSFPERADIYECDNCGADLTKHLRCPVSHSWPPYGPMRCVCQCGRAYLTGAVEWECLSTRERRERLGVIFALSLSLLVVLAIPGAFIGLLIGYLAASRMWAIRIGLIIAITPGLCMLVFEIGKISLSIWRTNALLRKKRVS
jgi:hypothetical protein